MRSSTIRARKPPARDPGRLQLERLEQRCLMDGALPHLVDDTIEVRSNQPARMLDVLANDEFDRGYAGDRRISAVSYGSEGGRVELSADRRAVVYTPPPDFEGVETFVYLVDNLAAARVTVTIVSPVVADHYEFVQASGAIDLDVRANDRFWPDYAGLRQIRFVSETSAGGDVEITDGGRQIRYTPPPDDTVWYDSFSYFVDDGYEAKVTIDLLSPVADDWFDVVEESTGNRLNLTDNDVVEFDLSERTVDAVDRITSVTAPSSGGMVEITPDGQGVRYTPAPGFVGTEHFDYVADGRHVATVWVNVVRATRDDWHDVDQNSTDNVLPLTHNDYASLYSPSFRTEYVVGRITSVTAPSSGGTVEITGDGQAVRYTPPPGFTGSDDFEYVADGRYAGTVRVSVTRPVRDDYVQPLQDGGATRLDVLANDFLSLHSAYLGDRVITAVTETARGAAVEIVAGGRAILYTPLPGFTGSDSFTYTVDDGFEASVGLNVRPRAQNDYYNFCLEPRFTLSVVDNDDFRTNYTGAANITAATDLSGNGTIDISAGGTQLSFTATRPAPFTSSIRYTVDDRYEATAQLNVYGYYSFLSYDNFTVDQNSLASALDVLANDNFDQQCWFNGTSRPYSGPRIITATGPSANGGEVTIGADGKTVWYSAPPYYVGHDSFTYVVDGIQQATVSVNVIRRVRDDRFRVGHDTADNSLAVLINDGFGTDYGGARQITAVTPTAAGGSVTIRDDGHAILYTPPAGFAGSDSFGYTVDGQLKARVDVVVQPPAVLEPFESDDVLEQFLIDRAVKRYSYLFDNPTQYAYPYLAFDDDRFKKGDLVATNDATSFSGSGSPSFSDTNVQVQGVDEGDIIENDGRYLYVLTGTELVIVQAWPAKQLHEVSRITLDGTPTAMFLHGDRLTVISNRYEQTPLPDPYGETTYRGGAMTDDVSYGSYWWRPVITKTFTQLTVIDLADRAAPHLLETADFEGTYVDSRAMYSSRVS